MMELCPSCASRLTADDHIRGRCHVCGNVMAGSAPIDRTRPGILLDDESTVPHVLPSASSELTLPGATPTPPTPVAGIELAPPLDFGASLALSAISPSPMPDATQAKGAGNGVPAAAPVAVPPPPALNLDDWEPHLQTDLLPTVPPGKQVALGAVVALAVGVALFLLFRLAVRIYHGSSTRTSAAVLEPSTLDRGQVGSAWGQVTSESVYRLRRSDPLAVDAVVARGMLVPGV